MTFHCKTRTWKEHLHSQHARIHKNKSFLSYLDSISGKNVIPKHPSRHPVIDAKGSSKVAFLAAKSSLKSFTSIFHYGRISYKIYIGFMCFTSFKGTIHFIKQWKHVCTHFVFEQKGEGGNPFRQTTTLLLGVTSVLLWLQFEHMFMCCIQKWLQ